MIDPDILPILRCPAEKSPLRLIDDEHLARLNAAIAAGTARDGLDQAVTQSIDGGLVNGSGSRVYPIRGSIPTLIVDEALVVG